MRRHIQPRGTGAIIRRKMIYFKSILAGTVAAIAAMFLTAVLVTNCTIAWLRLEMWRADSGSGGIGAVSAGIGEATMAAAVVLGVLGFVVGFRWEFRRASRRDR